MLWLLPWYSNGLVIISRLLSAALLLTSRVCNFLFWYHHVIDVFFFQIALIRSFLFEGVESFKMTTIVEGILMVLHIAVVLFILGLIQFLFSVNLIVAGVVLGIFLLSMLFYCGMTILPIIWAECPYRTPLSVLVRYAVIWAMKLISKILEKIYYAMPKRSLLERWSSLGWHKLVAITPDYDMAVTREKKARDLSSGASKHRIDRDLRWTLNSLTTDSELEPFVAGLPTLLSVSADQSESQEVSDAMITILLERYGLAARISELLHSCIPPTILSDGPRIKRATICLQAIYAICNTKKLETKQSIDFIGLLGWDSFSDDLLSFARLGSNDELAVSSGAVTISNLIATKMEAAARNGVLDVPLSMVMAVSQILGQFQLLRLVSIDNETVSSIVDAFADILADYSQENGEPSAEKQRWIQEFSQMIIRPRIRGTSFWSQFRPLSVVKSLAKFREEKYPAIGHRANCASACLAFHMQYHLFSSWVPYLPDVVEALTVFGTVLSEDRHTVGHIAINGELSLGVQFKDSTGNIKQAEWEEDRKWDEFKAKSIETFEKAFSEVASSAQYDRAQLDEVVVEDNYGCPVEVGYWGRVGINRGCTAILVIFLSSMRAFPPPEDTFDLTLVTLRIITKSLTAGYSSPSTQTVLVHLVGRISKQFHAHLALQDSPFDLPPNQGAQKKEEEGDPGDVIQENPVDVTDAGGMGANISKGSLTTAKYILPMLQALLEVIGTIAHPDSVEKAKKVVTTISNDFTEYEFPTVHADAVNVLAKVCSFFLCTEATD